MTLPASIPADAQPVIIFQTIGQIELATKPLVVKQSKESVSYTGGSLCDHSRKTAAVRSAASQNTLAHWADVEHWAEWHVEIAHPTGFKVENHQGCGKGQGENTGEIEIAGSKCQFEIEDTGHFQNFQAKTVGSVQVAEAGDFPLKTPDDQKGKGYRLRHPAVASEEVTRQFRLSPLPIKPK